MYRQRDTETAQACARIPEEAEEYLLGEAPAESWGL